MASGLITEYLGEGLAAARPATPDIPAGGIAFYYSTDTNELSRYAESAWAVVGTGALNLDDISDVDAAAPNDGDVLTFDSGSGDWVPEAPSGGGGTFIGARVRRTSDQTTANYTTQTAVPWQEEVVDTDGFWVIGAPTRLTIPVAFNGRYANVQASVRINLTATESYKQVLLVHYDSGGTPKFTAGQSVEVGFPTVYANLSLIGVPVVTDDYFELTVAEESDSSVTIAATSQTGMGLQII